MRMPNWPYEWGKETFMHQSYLKIKWEESDELVRMGNRNSID
jgi:hypothetical protein